MATINQKIFKCEHSNAIDDYTIEYHQCTMVRDWGPFLANQVFKSITLDFNAGEALFHTADDQEQTVEFELSVLGEAFKVESEETPNGESSNS